jgi:molybdate transport system substrate-binding protein
LAENAPIALADPPASDDGVAAQAALTSLGLWDGAKAHAIGTADTGDAAFLLAHKQAGAALVFATDVAADPDLAVAATLPDEAYPPVTYWWAETRQVRSAHADDFAVFLRTPQAQARLRAAGLEIAK